MIIVLVTISCDIRLSPKQEIDQYKLSNVYGPCMDPYRPETAESNIAIDLNGRKKRSEAEVTRLTISATQRITPEETDEQFSEQPIQQSGFIGNLISSFILLLVISA